MLRPRYVDVGNGFLTPPPYEHRNVRAHVFRVEADAVRVQETLDAIFWQPTAGAVRVWAPWSEVFVTFAEIDAVTSSSPYARAHGVVGEIDVSLWVPVVRTAPGRARLCWVPLWLFVDDALALVAGREVYGFPKQLGRFTLPGGAPASTEFVVRTLVVHPFSEAPRGRWRPVIRATPTELRPEPTTLWQTLAAASRALREGFYDLGDWSRIKDVVDDGVHPPSPGVVPMLFLKQIPAANDTGRAAYQAVIEGEAHVEAFRWGGYTAAEYSVELLSYDSHPFERVLGVGRTPQPCGRAMWADFDFTMHSGVTLWEAGRASPEP